MSTTHAGRAAAARDVFTDHETHLDDWCVLSRRSVLAPRRSSPTVVLVGGIAISGRYMVPYTHPVELTRFTRTFLDTLPPASGDRTGIDR